MAGRPQMAKVPSVPLRPCPDPLRAKVECLEEELNQVKIAMGWHLQIIGGGRIHSAPGTVTIELPTAQQNTPFAVLPNGQIRPGTVNGLMPIFNGEPLDTTAEVIDMTGTFKVWFKMTFSVTWTASDPAYLASYTLLGVEVDYGSSVPTSSATVKYLQLNTVTNGVPAISFYTRAFSVALTDAGPSATGLVHS